MRKRKPELRPEDCTTPELKLAYSKMMYERWQSIDPMGGAVPDFRPRKVSRAD